MHFQRKRTKLDKSTKRNNIVCCESSENASNSPWGKKEKKTPLFIISLSIHILFIEEHNGVLPLICVHGIRYKQYQVYKTNHKYNAYQTCNYISSSLIFSFLWVSQCCLNTHLNTVVCMHGGKAD